MSKVELDTAIVSRLVGVLERIDAKLSAPDPQVKRSAISVEKAAAMLECSRKHVFVLLREGKLKRGQKTGKDTTVTLASLEQFLNPAGRGARRSRAADKFEPFSAADLLR